jgi:hypothetical protein
VPSFFLSLSLLRFPLPEPTPSRTWLADRAAAVPCSASRQTTVFLQGTWLQLRSIVKKQDADFWWAFDMLLSLTAERSEGP